jgi:tripartite-type tricarboxylate transporter receptor subunit TctC
MKNAISLALVVVALLTSKISAEETFPTRPLQLVVPFTAGSAPDVMARVIGERLALELGQPVLVENRAGAGGNIAAEYASRQPGDGYTVFVGTTGNMAVAKSLYAKLAYDPAQSFTAVSVGWLTWNVLIVPANSKLRTVQDVIKEAKENPGKLNFGSPGVGTAGHLAGEWFKNLTGANITHVPYRGQNQVVQDLLGGYIQLSFETIGSAVPVIKNGQVRALAATSTERLPSLPDVPTFAEAGVRDLDLGGWGIFFVPSSTPASIVTRLNAALVKVMSMPDVRGRIDDLGAKTSPSTVAEAQAMLLSEIAKWGKIVEVAKVRIDN